MVPPLYLFLVRGPQHSGLVVEVVGTRTTASSAPDPPWICWLRAGWKGLSNPRKRDGRMKASIKEAKGRSN